MVRVANRCKNLSFVVVVWNTNKYLVEDVIPSSWLKYNILQIERRTSSRLYELVKVARQYNGRTWVRDKSRVEGIVKMLTEEFIVSIRRVVNCSQNDGTHSARKSVGFQKNPETFKI